MIVDNSYITRLRELYKEIMDYGGKVLAGFYAGKDIGLSEIVKELVLSYNCHYLIKNYDYADGTLTNVLIEEIHDILIAQRDKFKRLTQDQDSSIDSP